MARSCGDSLTPMHTRARIEIATLDAMEELVALAERYDRLILHQREDGIHSYVVEESNIAYWLIRCSPRVRSTVFRTLLMSSS
jgi:hypothetical protein